MPFSITMLIDPWIMPRYRGCALFASSILFKNQPALQTVHRFTRSATHNAVLTVSNGVTTNTLSMTPAAVPARIARPPLNFPFSSLKTLLILSNATNLAATFNDVPTITVLHPT
jgi:hypothetical protein